MKKGHIVIALCGIVSVWLGNAFINADLNPFNYSTEARSGMIIIYLFEQVIAQLIYSAIAYKFYD